MNLNEIDYRNFGSVSDLLTSSLYESLKKKDDTKKKKSEEEEEIDKNHDRDKADRTNRAKRLPVVYADLDKAPTCIFKHIIIFTNNKDPKENKTLKNLEDAIQALPEDERPELHVFIAAKTDSDDNGHTLIIADDDDEFKIEDQSNIDTLVFSRLGVQGEDECEEAVKLLQDRGFLVLNPVRYSELASNKLESAFLFGKGDIPQPRFCAMTKDVLYDEKEFNENMKRVYEEFDEKNPDGNAELDVVVKILDGHGGTGVFTCDCKKLVAILQTIFAINPEQNLIIQRKEDGDGGDIRVHVLTLRNKQIILAAMKRQQLGGDFRSNVSLGAQAIKVTLTPEQEQIALKTAQISKLPWCAVDIMPLKGKNIDGYKDVVLEINASPGTDGITDVIKHNFINVMLNELGDPAEFMLQDKNAGFIESVEVKFDDSTTKQFLAKLDTGNSTGASTLEVGEYEESGNKITFSMEGKKFTYKKVRIMRAEAGEEVYERPVIIIPMIKVGQRKVRGVPVALVKNRNNKTTNMLLNRDVLSRLGYIINPSQSHILTDEIQKVKIVN